MAKLIPEFCVKNQRPHSEAIVFKALKKQLNNDWLIFHSFDYITNDTKRRDGEIDFIVCHKEYGFLLIEVKGGEISYNKGVWKSGDNVINPIHQVRRSKYDIYKMLLGNREGILNLNIAHAVCFPFCDEIKNVPPEAKDIIITQNDLTRIEPILISILKQRTWNKRKAEKLIQISFEEIIDFLSPKFEALDNLPRRISENEKVFAQLSEEQCKAFSMLENFKRLNVKGCAGSGKTILAMNLAKNHIATKENVLLLCYNKLLANSLKKTLKKDSKIQVRAFFDFCAEVAGITQEEMLTANSDFYEEELPKLAKDALIKNNITYQSIIVDEGQDFNANAWDTILAMREDDGYLHVFYDEDQNIFNNELCIPKTDYPEVELRRNHRNSEQIFKYIKKYIAEKNVSVVDGIPEGQKVEEYFAQSKEERLEILRAAVDNLRKKGVSPNSIVILGAHSMQNTCIADNTEIADVKISDAEIVPNGYISYRTYMKFKGCESPVVIAIDVDKSDPRWEKESACYTAFSRAKSILIIIYKKNSK